MPFFSKPTDGLRLWENLTGGWLRRINVTALFPRTGDDQMSPGAFKFLWGGLFGNVAETLAFLTQDEAQTTWANIIGESFSCEAYDRGYFFQKVSQ